MMRYLSNLKLVFQQRFITQNSYININILNGIALAIATNLVNPYYAKFAERMGATDYHIAYLNSLPAFVSLFALIPGAIFLDVFGSKMKNTTWMMLIHKLFFLIIAFIPIIQGVSKPWLFIVLVALMNLPGAIYTMGYQSSIGDIFTARERGLAMGLRNRYSDIFRLGITLVSGILLSIPRNDNQVILLYQIFFIASFAIGILEVVSFSRFSVMTETQSHTEPDHIRRVWLAIQDSFRFSITNKGFKQFMIASLLFHFGWQMGWPLFNIYTITKLGANEAWLSAIAIAGGLTAILTATKWARFADKKGNQIAAVVATFGMSTTPFLYVLSESLTMLVVFNILIGFSVTGTALVLFNLLLEATPKQNRTTIISIYNTVIAVSATIAPVFGVWLMRQTSLEWSLIVTGLLRFVGCGAFWLGTRKKNDQGDSPH
ncbi:MAG TPA: hypothetical protein DCS67_08680 [Clostridiales bacterium UBA8960]|nr:hypothetical protein [Clostridiales bacterium UBA8960]